MTFQAKTAKDLPAGAEMQTRWATWTKQPNGLWTNSQGHTRTNAEIDHLLSSGGMLTRVPTGTHTKEQ